MNQYISIETTDSSFLNCTLLRITDYIAPNTCFMDKDSMQSLNPLNRTLWRLYPHSGGRGFAIRPIDPNLSDGFAWNTECKYLGTDRTEIVKRDDSKWGDDGPKYKMRISLKSFESAASFQLIQSSDCNKDQYHIQLVDDEVDRRQFLNASNPKHYHFQNVATRKTMIGLHSHRRYIEEWRQRLVIGSDLWIFDQFEDGDHVFYRGKVVELWNSKHEQEIKVRFMGFPDDESSATLIQREEWVPIGSTDCVLWIVKRRNTVIVSRSGNAMENLKVLMLRCLSRKQRECVLGMCL